MKVDKFNYEDELHIIKQLRSGVYKLDVPILLMIALGAISQVVFPFIAPLFGLLAFLIFYRKLLYVARYPCPKCHASFGCSSKIVLGFGGNTCQNCGLNLLNR